MTVSITDLYQILSDKIGKDEAKALTSFVEEKIEQQIEQKATILATKVDLHEMERHINNKSWAAFITLIVMILGLYATILLRFPVTPMQSASPAVYQTDSTSKR